MTPPDFSTPHTVGKVLIEAADGAVNSVAPDATAFVHRDNLFVTQYQARWHETRHASIAEANVAWTDGLYAAVSEHRSGSAYQNYIDAELEDWERAYYGANLDRLRAVKARYDPDEPVQLRPVGSAGRRRRLRPAVHIGSETADAIELVRVAQRPPFRGAKRSRTTIRVWDEQGLTARAQLTPPFA